MSSVVLRLALQSTDSSFSVAASLATLPEVDDNSLIRNAFFVEND